MTLSRWKMMAGVLGVSLGGLAAIAAQCPKNDTSKGGVSSEAPKGLDIPMFASAKAPPMAPAVPMIPAALPELPAPPAGTLPALPALPSKPMEAKPPVKMPDHMPVVPASATEPKPPLPKPAQPELPKPTGLDKNPTAPALPAVEPPTKPTLLLSPGSPDPLVTPPQKPAPDLAPRPNPPVPNGAIAPSDPLFEPAPALVKPTASVTATAVTPAVPTKFRILLRVGEGEPTFEVRCGDDLVLKVTCEKVDIKSPEKGNGLSAVKASGKVRFAGFGAEGICDELSFLAGTGEVSMVGAVKIQVKDKLGRIESELSTENIKYKLDPSPAGAVRP